jgi:hypothetical protein
MAEIFLSYRRQDSQSATGRLADDLQAHFGDERVFRDHEIAAGDDFVDAIRRSVESATVLLAVVGPRWLGATDAAGRRRLDDPEDFVRLEIELALGARVPIVPVLVEGATMPGATALPASIVEFARCQAVEVADKRWRYDVQTLIAMLQSRFAIDAGIESPASSPTSPGGLTRLTSDVLDLALHPTRLIARRQTGRASDAARAFVFLAAAILVGNIVLLLGLDVPLGAERSGALSLSARASWLLAGELVGLLLALLLVSALALTCGSPIAAPSIAASAWSARICTAARGSGFAPARSCSPRPCSWWMPVSSPASWTVCRPQPSRLRRQLRARARAAAASAWSSFSMLSTFVWQYRFAPPVIQSLYLIHSRTQITD